MTHKKLTDKDYERISKENLELYAKLDRQIAAERKKEDEFLSALSEDEQVEYLWEKAQRVNAEAADKFHSVKELTIKKDE